MVKLFVKFVALLLISATGSFTLLASESTFELQYHPVGEGNCVTAKLRYADGQNHNMMFDCGSRSAYREFLYRQHFVQADTPIKTKLAKNLAVKIGKEVRSSIIEPTSQHVHKQLSIKFNYDYKDEQPNAQQVIIQGIKEALSIEQKNVEQLSLKRKPQKIDSTINCQLIVISHPDADHYAWLPQVFGGTEYKIDTIILGGLPEEYNKNLFDFLLEVHAKKTKIFFPALSFQPVQDLELLNIKLQNITRNVWATKVGNAFKPQVFSHPQTGQLMSEPNIALPDEDNFVSHLQFGTDFKIFFMSINPTHFKDFNDDILRFSSSGEKNDDSLVLKLKFKNQSAILSGDATGLVTKRIRSNYKHAPEFLKSDTIDGAHHGSATEDSNDLIWIQAVAPSYVFFNNGIAYGHPAIQTYENYRAMNATLKKVDPHEVWVGKFAGLKYLKETMRYITQRAIFSTLNSGLLTVKFDGTESITVTSTLGNLIREYKPIIEIEVKDDIAGAIKNSIDEAVIEDIEAKVAEVEAEPLQEDKEFDEDDRDLKRLKVDAGSSSSSSSSSSNPSAVSTVSIVIEQLESIEERTENELSTD